MRLYFPLVKRNTCSGKPSCVFWHLYQQTVQYTALFEELDLNYYWFGVKNNPLYHGTGGSHKRSAGQTGLDETSEHN